MASPAEYLVVGCRVVRLHAAVALGEQNRVEAAVLESLSAQLAQAERELEALQAAAGEALPIATLSVRLGLRRVDELLLLAAVALEIDPLFAVTFTALGGQEPQQGLSARRVAQLLRFAGDESLALGLDRSHPLVRAGLLESPVTGEVVDTLKSFRAGPRVIGFLGGQDEVDPLLERLGGIVAVPAEADFEGARVARELLERVLATGENVIVALEGSDGVGRRTLLATVARSFGRAVVSVDAGRLSPERPRFLAELRALRRECWLRGALPVVARLDALSRRVERPAERFAEVAEALESPGAVIGPVLVTFAPGTELPEFQRRVVRLRLDPPGPTARLGIWTRALAASTSDPAPLAEELAQTVQHYGLTPAGIQRAAENTRLLARGRAIEPADIRAGVSAEIQARFAGLAMRLEVSQSWDDLVLPSDTLDDVKAFASRAVHAAQVYDRWGFRDKLGRGFGLAALFSGPPGTGKTMVAGLIASRLGLELYQVDLSQVVSKWVGETEKQLGKIFDAAAMGQALLLFDEADALFAKRTEVKSSNDRYANLEVNYLLQRIEQFGGVAILTTNLEASVDPAFKRRLAADVRFYPPERAERERLWRALLPPQAPVAGEIKYAVLADGYKDMCGGHIRNAILRAAFLAAAEGVSITHEHLNRAARVEYRAMGKVL